jgi:orotidine-5'-phosphate decarboxylase
MAAVGFRKKLAAAAARNRSLLCVGLDPVVSRIPVADVAAFNRAIVGATCDLVCAYKPNLAFYERLGRDGMRALEATLAVIPADIVTIADAKRGDFEPASAAYADAILGRWGFDSVTVNPYLGRDSLQPFMERGDKGVFVVCRSSNPGAADFQQLPVVSEAGARPLYLHVADKVQQWDKLGNAGLVVGATAVPELRAVRELCPSLPILVPGVGAQGGDLEGAIGAGVDSGGRGVVVNASRQVLYARDDEHAFQEAAREAAMAIREAISAKLTSMGLGW